MRPFVSVAALLALTGCATPGEVLTLASGSVSQTLCSKVFVSGLDPAAVYAVDRATDPGVGLIGWALRYEVDTAGRTVTARIGGGFETVSAFNSGRGCTLRHEAWPVADLPPPPPAGPALLAPIAGAEPVAPASPALAAALDAAFVEAESGPRRATEAVLVTHRGRLVAERYAQGFGVDTPMLSRSLAKSVTSALVGVLVREGRLDPARPAPLPAWRTAGDPHAAITLEQLLRMTAGYGFDDNGGVSPSARLWFLEPDAAAAAAAQDLDTAPGAAWGYSSRSYLLAARVAADAVGGGPAGYDAFARRELFEPLGMEGALLEFDNAGTPMGGHAMFATARDWARFGQLYLNDGVVGGRRILPEGWVAWSTAPTLDSSYGAGWWLNASRTGPPEAGRWGLPGAPPDAFMARGYLGQYIVVVPSRQAVIVRLGTSRTPNHDLAGTQALVRAVLAALPK